MLSTNRSYLNWYSHLEMYMKKINECLQRGQCFNVMIIDSMYNLLFEKGSLVTAFPERLPLVVGRGLTFEQALVDLEDKIEKFYEQEKQNRVKPRITGYADKVCRGYIIDGILKPKSSALRTLQNYYQLSTEESEKILDGLPKVDEPINL